MSDTPQHQFIAQPQHLHAELKQAAQNSTPKPEASSVPPQSASQLVREFSSHRSPVVTQPPTPAFPTPQTPIPPHVPPPQQVPQLVPDAVTSEQLEEVPLVVSVPVKKETAPNNEDSILEPSLKSMKDEDNIDIISILVMAVEKQASDVYLKAESPAIARVMGQLLPLTEYKLSAFGVEKLAKSLMNDKQNVRFAENLSLDMSFAAKGIGRFRVNIYRQRGTVALVLRRIKTEVPTLEQLNLPDVLKTVAMQKRGLVLLTGSTGSGKTSSLAAMLDYRNQNSAGHIITIEDPIEFVLEDKGCIVSQREIDIDTLNWERALIDAMREAPDVVLIGEMRDLFGAKTALNLSETGHLVMSTLHSTDTLQTLERLIAMFPKEQHEELYLRLSLSLVGIVCQRLVVTKDKKNRYPAIEVMLTSPRVRDLIRKGDINLIKETIAISRSEGMQTFDQHLLELWKSGVITDEEALLHSDSPNNLRLLMKGISYSGAE
ncbi:MAG: PilT/PilU family type 4a pilus ATPase [bacterium]